MSNYIVMWSAAKMPGTCWGKYRRIAIVKVADPGIMPKMISTHARNVLEIVQTWEKLNVGKTSKSAFYRALVEADALCRELNHSCKMP